MAISYNKYWKLMIDKGLNKTKLRTEAGISSNAMAKLGKNESVPVSYTHLKSIGTRFKNQNCRTENRSTANGCSRCCRICPPERYGTDCLRK